MIYEYALEPEMVATWGDKKNCRFFSRAFGIKEGRFVSYIPNKWFKKVWDSCNDLSDMNKKRLTELLVKLKKAVIKREGYHWDETQESWLCNALTEHERYPFFRIMARSNPKNRPEILTEDDIDVQSSCPGWDIPHGITVNRNASKMASAIKTMLSCCRWIKFIDPHISPEKQRYKESLKAFLKIVGNKRPAGSVEAIEIHISLHVATTDFLREKFEKVIPSGLQATLFQWQKKPNGPRPHNRYILTNLGGVSFYHGLDTGEDTETDDISRLDLEQYNDSLKQYDYTKNPALDQAASPLKIIGKHRENNKTMPKRVSPRGQK